MELRTLGSEHHWCFSCSITCFIARLWGLAGRKFSSLYTPYVSDLAQCCFTIQKASIEFIQLWVEELVLDDMKENGISTSSLPWDVSETCSATDHDNGRGNEAAIKHIDTNYNLQTARQAPEIWQIITPSE